MGSVGRAFACNVETDCSKCRVSESTADLGGKCSSKLPIYPYHMLVTNGDRGLRFIGKRKLNEDTAANAQSIGNTKNDK